MHIPLDATTRKSKAIAFVKFSDASCAVKAFEELDKTSFQGRLLHILPAVEREDSGAKGVEFGTKQTVKGNKERKQKEASGKEFNWAMLYMNVSDRLRIYYRFISLTCLRRTQ